MGSRNRGVDLERGTVLDGEADALRAMATRSIFSIFPAACTASW